MKKSNYKKSSKSSIHLCLISCFPPSKGPLSEYTYHLAKNLAKSSKISRITVLADKISDGDELSIDKKIEVIRCWNLNNVFASLNILINIHKIKPNIVYFNLDFLHFSDNRIKNFLGLSSTATARLLLNVPVVVTLHDIVEQFSLDNSGYKYQNSSINKFGSRLATKLILKADVVTLTHQHLVNILRKEYGGKNVIYVPHGTFYEPIANFNFNGKKRLLLFGKMGPYKNITLALEAFKEILPNNKDTELVVAGSSHPLIPGFLESILEKYKQIPNIKVTGYIPEHDLQRIFTSSTAVVLPYKESVWSSGVFALASIYGIPVIASDLPDFRELVKEGAGIILFPSGDREALSKTMELVLNDKELQRKLGEANLQWARKNSFDQVSRRLIKVFEDLTGKADEITVA
jgi:glycosyltransferase involved in cell wall biosynthesis